MITTQLKEYVSSRESEVNQIANVRSSEEETLSLDEFRSDADVDYARILYASSFRRLQGKMQLLVPGHIHFYRNRLTHSLEVAQIARSIAKRIGMEDILTVQSCSLAHDIGNPPFGHAGEKYLSECVKGLTFEGNAQSFRILTNIEDKFYDCNGLNLTLRTLLGIVKYPYSSDENPKKHLYKDDYSTVKSWHDKYKLQPRSIDCEVMDIADEIAYAAHDLEDALRMKCFTIDDILYEFYESEFKSCFNEFENLVAQSREYASKAHAYKNSEEYSILFLRKLTSLIVNKLILDVGLVTRDGSTLLGYKSFACLAKGLKKLTFKAITRRPEVIQYELMGRSVIKGLFEVYSDKNFNKDMKLLPAEYRDDPDKERTILDYIGGMMDSYAIDQYKLYFGTGSLDSLYPNFQKFPVE